MSKQIIFLILLMVAFSVSFAGIYSGGNGTQANPYQIATTNNLIELSNTQSDWIAGKYFIQTANIIFDEDETKVDWDGDGDANWDTEDQKGFAPIGNSGSNFAGNYNGQNYTISNLYIKRSGNDNIALFGAILSATIQNIGLLNSNIHGHNNVGGLVGYQKGGFLTNNYSVGDLIGTNNTGGLVGYQKLGNNMGNYSLGSVSGFAYTGAFVGYLDSGLVINCYSKSSAYGNMYTGGFVGWIDSGMVNNSYSTGSVGASYWAGGFVGYLEGGSVNNCYSLGSANANIYAGGFVGYHVKGTINNSFSIGSASSILYNGGFAGSVSAGEVNNCFWDIDASGQSGSAAAQGKHTNEMKTITTFTNANWDFTTIWDIQDGTYLSSYPYLRNINYDTPGATPVVNPIPGIKILCQANVYFDTHYSSSYPLFNKTQFNDLAEAMKRVCTGTSTLHIADVGTTTFTGSIDFSDINVVLGNYDFELNGNINGGLIQTTNNGRLVMKSISPNITKTFPITDGTHDNTVTFTTASNILPDIFIKINNNTSTIGRICNDFIDISGTEDLDATITFKIEKSTIAPKVLTSVSQIRKYDNTKNRYIPLDGNHSSIIDEGSYYLITLTNVNKY